MNFQLVVIHYCWLPPEVFAAVLEKDKQEAPRLTSAIDGMHLCDAVSWDWPTSSLCESYICIVYIMWWIGVVYLYRICNVVGWFGADLVLIHPMVWSGLCHSQGQQPVVYSLVSLGLCWWVSKELQSLADRGFLSDLAKMEWSSWQGFYCIQSKVQFNWCSCCWDVPACCFLPENLKSSLSSLFHYNKTYE